MTSKGGKQRMNFSWETRKHHYSAEIRVYLNNWAIPLFVGFDRPFPLEIPTCLIMLGPIGIVIEKRIIVENGGDNA